MANRVSGDARHAQSVKPMLDAAAANGWRVQTIEHDGIRQYRFTAEPRPVDPVLAQLTGVHTLARTMSAYFTDTAEGEDDPPNWRFVIGFDHAEPEVPLRLTAVVEALS